MIIKKIPPLRIGDLSVNIPIVQGAMGVGISLSGLASAVANAGGIGVIATPGIGQFEPDYDSNPRNANNRGLQKEIRKAKSMTSGIIGVNVMVALSNFDELVQCAVDEKADLLFLGAGLPLKLPETLPLDRLDEVSTKFVPIVSSGRAATLIFKTWQKRYKRVPDAVVVEGPMAGGHLGFSKEQVTDPDYKLEKLVPQVVEAIKPFEDQFNKNIPVIAGGGIYTGADIHRIMDLGAQGVQMATRFVATHECDASDIFKETYLKSKKEDITLIDSPVGMPGRAIRNEFLERVSSGARETFKCSWRCLRSCNFKNVPYCIASALTNAKIGNLDAGFAFAGANAYRVDKIISVKELVDSLVAEYLAVENVTAAQKA